ncbi:hypothetical protein FAVG1_06857 [Fusarium avenaceum]|nr:hypothetical protein FAVG1_06857 [Fusarium avenaceum]
MQVNIFKVLAITAALSTVQSVPVETDEGSVARDQIDKTHINEAVVDEAVKPCDASDPCSAETEESRIPGRPQMAFDDAYLPPH